MAQISISVGTFWVIINAPNVIHQPSPTLSAAAKTRDSFANWTCEEYVPYFLQCNFQFKNCFWLRFKLSKNFVHHSSDVISPGNSNLESYSWPLFILNHLQTVRKPALLSNTYSVRRCGGSTKPSVATTESWLFASTGQILYMTTNCFYFFQLVWSHHM